MHVEREVGVRIGGFERVLDLAQDRCRSTPPHHRPAHRRCSARAAARAARSPSRSCTTAARSRRQAGRTRRPATSTGPAGTAMGCSSSAAVRFSSRRCPQCSQSTWALMRAPKLAARSRSSARRDLAQRQVGDRVGRQLGPRPGGEQRAAVERVARRPALPQREHVGGRRAGASAALRRQLAGSVKLGSDGSTTSTSRSQPSFSSLMCWIATALALASRSGSAWYSETQQR